jgi:hypothetical protein
MSHDILEPPSDIPDQHELFLTAVYDTFADHISDGKVELLWMKNRDIVPIIAGFIHGGEHAGMTGIVRDVTKNPSGKHDPEITYRFDVCDDDSNFVYAALVNQVAGVSGWKGGESFMRNGDFTELNNIFEGVCFSKFATAQAIEHLQNPQSGTRPADILFWQPSPSDASTKIQALWEKTQDRLMLMATWMGKGIARGYGYDLEM